MTDNHTAEGADAASPEVALRTLLDRSRPAQTGWTEELRDRYELFEERPDLSLTPEEHRRFTRQRERETQYAEACALLTRLRDEARDGTGTTRPAEIARLAERSALAGLAVAEAVGLLRALGAPHGERALRRLVHDEALSEADRARARERLRELRRPGYAQAGAAAAAAVTQETPLLPDVVRRPPHGWARGLFWSGAPDRTPENLAYAYTVLDALLPPDRLSPPEPPPEWTGDWDEDADERPEWLETRIVLAEFVPSPREVTRERLAAVRDECELLGLVRETGHEYGGGGAASDGFERTWARRIGAWLAESVLDWLGRYGGGPDGADPRVISIAEEYARRGCATAAAVQLLIRTSGEPRSGEVLARLAGDAALPDDVREQAAEGLAG